MKILAKELKVPVIALSQLSRGVEQRQDKRPVLSDIRESGSIEQDADIVAFLYRDDYYERGGEEEEGIPNNKVEVIIEKNRSGARGTVEINFQKDTINFQVSQRGRHKMSDAFTDVAKDEKNPKKRSKAHEGQVVEMTLENGRKRQKNRLGKLIEVYPSLFIVEFGDVEGDKQANVYVESFTYSDILTEKNLIRYLD